MTQVTPKKDYRQVFLDKLSKSPNVSAAAKAAGYSRKFFYELRKEDLEFAEQWQEALDSSLDTAEGELYRRAVRGVVKRIYYQDKQIDTVREYSDTLLIFLLKSHKPEVYRETVRNENTGKDGGPMRYEDAGFTDEQRVDRVVSLFDKARARRNSQTDGNR